MKKCNDIDWSRSDWYGHRRRMGYGMKIVIGDKNQANADAISKTINEAGFDTVPVEMNLSSRSSILNLIAEAQKYGEISMLVNAAGVSPSQAPVETILKVDLYGTAVLLEEVGRVIAPGGTGVTISSQREHPALMFMQTYTVYKGIFSKVNVPLSKKSREKLT